MASIARENLFANIPRLVIAQAGILFAVSLVTLQTGIFLGFSRSVSALVDQSKADMWITPKSVDHLGVGIPLQYERLGQTRQVEGVARAEAVIFRGDVWRNSRDETATITLIGLDPQARLFAPLTLSQGNLSDLKPAYTLLVDKSNLGDLNVTKVGDKGVIGGLPAEVAGFTQGVQSIIFSPIVFMSLQSAKAYTTTPPATRLPCEIAAEGIDCRTTPTDFPPTPTALTADDAISYILVQAEANTDLERLKQQLANALPDSRIWTRAEFAQSNQTFWEQRSNIGVILGLGAAIGIVVGIVVVGQILYASVSEHIKQFGTLKAMGASPWVIYGVIGEQALWMAVLGYIPGLVLSIVVAEWVIARGIIILILPTTAAGIFGVTLLMCFTAAAFAIRKVMRVDPATVFRS